MKIKLTEQQLQNLQIFLNRVTLQGSEVSAFIEIMQAISNSIEDEDNK